MGRTVVADDSVAGNLSEWSSGDGDNFGLVVGQLSSTSTIEDQIAFLAPTLPPQEDKVELEEEEDEDPASEASSSRGESASKDEPPAFVDLNELTSSWVTHHSQQLSRLLSGGLDIIGIFAVCAPEHLAELTKSGKLKSFFSVLEKQTSKRNGGGGGKLSKSCSSNLPHSDRYLLHGCTKTKAVSCLTLDVADVASGSGFKSATVRFQDGLLTSWSQIDCQIGLDCVIDIPASKLSKYSLKKQIQQGLAPTLKEWSDSRIVLTRAKGEAAEAEEAVQVGKLPSLASLLADVGKTPEMDSSSSTPSSSSSKAARKGGGRKGQGDSGSKKTSATLPVGGNFQASVFKLVGNKYGDSCFTSSSLDCATQMVLRGTICARAHLHAKASVEDSIAALKKDMVHSILTRIELLCDSMLTEEDQETLPTSAVIYELPVRIFAPIAPGVKTGVSIADFMFRDEKKQDAVEMIKEVTGKDILEDSLEVSAESFMPVELSAASSIDSLASHQSGTALEQDSKYSKSLDGGQINALVAVKDFCAENGVIVACLFGATASLYSAYLHFSFDLF